MPEVFVFFVLAIIVMLAVSYSKQRYRGPGEVNDARNLEEYGEPVRTLYTSTEVFTLHHRIAVTDEDENVVYKAETQFPSIYDKTDIYTADNRHIAHIERKLLTLHEIHYIDMDDGRSFTLSNELMHIIRDVTNIEELGWVMEGNFLQLNFSVRDAGGDVIAVVSQKMFSIHDKYALDIYKPEYEEEVVAILITLQHMIRDRQGAAASGGGSSSS